MQPVGEVEVGSAAARVRVVAVEQLAEAARGGCADHLRYGEGVEVEHCDPPCEGLAHAAHEREVLRSGQQPAARLSAGVDVILDVVVGASALEPLPVRDGSYLRMNIDIGNQSAGVSQGVVLGDIANSRRCEQSPQWERKPFEGRPIPASISIPSSGRVWLLFGVDSGFEARTGIYFTRAEAAFRPM